MLAQSPLSAIDSASTLLASPENLPLGITFKFPIGLQELSRLSTGILLVLVIVVVAVGLAWFYTK